MVQLIHKNKRAIIITVIAFLNVLILLKLNYQCPWRQSLHIYCAGCGGTRMLKSVLKLDFYQAFRYNPLLFILLIIFIIYLIYITIYKLLKKEYYKLKTNHLYILLFLTITFMIIRNIEVFSYLKPTIIYK